MGLRFSEEQRLAIEAFFAHHNWDYVETFNKNPDECQEYDDAFGPGFVIPQNSNEDECPQCLCRPCITSASNKQM